VNACRSSLRIYPCSSQYSERFEELETGRDEANGKASLLQMVFGIHIMPVDCQRFEKV
jgi:hypothetical protein